MIFAETVFIEGTKYILKKNLDVNKVLLNIYSISAQHTVKIMKATYNIEIYFDERLFRSKLINTFVLSNYHNSSSEKRIEILLNMILNNNIFNVVSSDSDEKRVEYAKLFCRQFFQAVKSELSKEEYGFRLYELNELEGINKKIDDVKIKNDTFEALYREKEEYRRRCKEFEEEYNLLQGKYIKLAHIIHNDRQPINNLLQDDVFSKVGKSLYNDLCKAVECYNSERFIDCFNILKTYNSVLGDNHIYKYLYANTCYRLKYYDTAINEFRAMTMPEYIVKYDGEKMKKMLLYFGDCLFVKKDFNGAIEQYVKSYNIDNNFIEPYFNIGLSIWKLSVINEHEFDTDLLIRAKHIFEDVVSKRPEHVEARQNAGYLQLLRGEIDAAIESFIVSSSLCKDELSNLECYIQLTICYLFKQDNSMALNYIKKSEDIIKKSNVNEKIMYNFYFNKLVYFADVDYKEWTDAYEQIRKYPGNSFTAEPGHTLLYEVADKTVVKSFVNK